MAKKKKIKLTDSDKIVIADAIIKAMSSKKTTKACSDAARTLITDPDKKEKSKAASKLASCDCRKYSTIVGRAIEKVRSKNKRAALRKAIGVGRCKGRTYRKK